MFEALAKTYIKILKLISPVFMKNSLAHLPKSKQLELQKIAAVIYENCQDIEKIILFGSYARGDYNEEKDLTGKPKQRRVSDYDILAITKTKEAALDSMLWKRINEELKKLNLSASPRIITHDIEALNIKLAEEQYFYSDIKKEGITLFDSENFELASPRALSSQERQRIAQDHFDEWFGAAESFFKGYKFYLGEMDFKRAAFSLHQSAESAYKTVLLVFSNYIPSEHFLQFLGEKAGQYSDLMKNIFSKISQEDEERFKLLEYAYIGGRYDPNYRITEEDLELLAKDVQKLLKLTEEVCQEKIKSFS
jgi:predicted nucleotidyltransferase/HEPN domain-containing protein